MLDKPKRQAPKSGHPRAKAPLININEPGRLRVAHLMALFAVSHAALYIRRKNGVIPPPDGADPRPYWLTSTVRPFLTPPAPSDTASES